MIRWWTLIKVIWHSLKGLDRHTTKDQITEAKDLNNVVFWAECWAIVL